MQTGSSTTIGRTSSAAFPLLAELELAAPFWHYQRLFAAEQYSFLLDSAKDPEKLGRCSFVGGDPVPGLQGQASGYVLAGRRQRPDRGHASPRCRGTSTGDAPPRNARSRRVRRPATSACSANMRSTLARVPNNRFHWWQGAVGYFGYEAGHFVEELPDRGADDLGLPDVYFMFHNVLLAHLPSHGTVVLVGHGSWQFRTRGPAACSPLARRDAATHRNV